MGVGGAIIGSALIGGAANYLSSRNANRPRTTNTSSSSSTTQTLRPYGGTQPLDNISNLAGLGLGFGLQNMPFGPSAGQTEAVDFIRQAALRGIPAHGVGAPSLPQIDIGPVHGAGSPELDAALGRLREGVGRPSSYVGSLGIPLTDMTPQEIAAFVPDPDPYLAEVMSGKFLGENPYLDDVIEGIQEDALRAYSRAVPPQLDANFARAGRLGSNAYSAAQGEAFSGFDRNLRDTVANIRAGSYESERDRMMQAAGMNVEAMLATRAQLMNARNSELASATALRQQAIAAWQQGAIAEAQMLNQQAMQHADLASRHEIAQAELDARLSIAEASMGLEAEALNSSLALQSNAQNMQNLMGLFGVQSSLQDETRRGALAPLGLVGGYADILLPMLAQFGTQQATQSGRGLNTAPGAGISPIGSFLTGGLGGASTAYSLLGGKNQAPSYGSTGPTINLTTQGVPNSFYASLFGGG